MAVLAIDPGPRQSAYVIWDGREILSMGILPNALLRDKFAGQINHDLVIEAIVSYGMPVGEDVFRTAYWIGRFDPMESAMLLPRKVVKLHLCNSFQANDANIRHALLDRFGDPGTRQKPETLYGVKTHLWSALALAVTAQDRWYELWEKYGPEDQRNGAADAEKG